jgi:hypothetical protein
MDNQKSIISIMLMKKEMKLTTIDRATTGQFRHHFGGPNLRTTLLWQIACLLNFPHFLAHYFIGLADHFGEIS